MTPLEVWHGIYDLAIACGREPHEAIQWADAGYWPTELNAELPDDLWYHVSPYALLPDPTNQS